MKVVLTLACLLAAIPGAADTVFESPLAGRARTDWFIGNFRDHGDGTAPRDYLGGFQTYIGHGGIDLWTADYKTMDDGIDVVAAAAGTVREVVDQFYELDPGGSYLYPSPYISVQHADGSQAVYYHIVRGSAVVRPGDAVAAGQKLARLGAHLHFEVQAGGRGREIMTHEAGMSQSFDWFDSYSNQVLRQVLSMGVTATNDPVLRMNFFEQTPAAYSRKRSGPFVLWIKAIGCPLGESLRVRLRAESGPGWDLDLTDWPWRFSYDAKWNWGYWYVWALVDGTTYRLQHRWNDGAWTDAPGVNLVVADDASDEEAAVRYSPHYTRYVNAASASPAAPFTSWATAARTIQEAVDAARDGDVVIVSNGVYETGSVVIRGAATRVAIARAVAVRSANGPQVTVIRGAPAGNDGSGGVRCAYVTNGAFLAGFTLSDGAAPGANGGGAWLEPYGALVNCMVRGCTASNGGGVHGGYVVNGLVAGNRADALGGGVYSGACSSCTLADNTAGVAGGGGYGGYLLSCIAWYNSTAGLADNFQYGPGSWVWACCLPGAEPASLSLSNEPAFEDRPAGNYRILPSSPCRDRGVGGASWCLDLDQNLRQRGAGIDMGAYEFAEAPPTPWGVVASDGQTRRVRVDWIATPRAESYRVWRAAVTAEQDAALVAFTSLPGWDDTSAMPGVYYAYAVEALRGTNTSAWSWPEVGWRRSAVSSLLGCDFNADGAADLAVYDPAGGCWYALGASNIVTAWQQAWGWPGATPVPGDYDGDGCADLAVFDPLSGCWYIASPAAPDFGLPISDLELEGQEVGSPEQAFDRQSPIENPKSLSVIAWALPWGWPGAWPVAGDYNGDATSDLAVFDAASGWWYVASPVSPDFGLPISGLGLEGQEVGTPEQALNRQSQIENPKSPSVIAWALPWGWPGARPVAGDYDGDGCSDFAVFEPVSGCWYILAATGDLLVWQRCWGVGDQGVIPVPGDFDGDGACDLAIYDVAEGAWYVATMPGRVLAWQEPWGWPGAVPVAGDYDGDACSDFAVFDPATGCWYVRSLDGRVLVWQTPWGWPGARPPAGQGG